MEERRERANNRNKGFTLVETVVVGVILVLLLSLGTAGLIQYQHYSIYKKNNEFAQTIFSAAQSSLTYYKTSGKLDELEAQVKDSKVDQKACGIEDNVGTLHYLDFTKDDYATLMRGGSLSGKARAFMELLGDYIYKTEVYNAAIRIEFNAEEGVVYSVCYSNRATEFDESNRDGKDGGTMGVAKENRADDRRSDIYLGYYCVEDSINSTPTDQKKPKIKKAELVNDETLMLRWNMDDDYKDLTSLFQYTVKINVENAANLENGQPATIAFTVNNKDNINNVLRLLQENDSTNNIKTTVSYYDNTGQLITNNGQYPKELQFKAYITNDTEQNICLILDAADLAASDKLASRQDGSGDPLEAKAYTDTYSALRLGLRPTDKIHCTVQAEADYYKPSSVKSSGTQYAFMGGAAANQTYFLKNARHLFNVRFTECAYQQKYDKATTEPEKAALVHGYQQREENPQHKDIVWGSSKGIIANGNLYDAQSKKDDRTLAFPSIEKLESNASFNVSGNCSIRYLKLAAEDTSGNQAKDVLGLFRYNAGTVSDVTFTNVQVDGTKDQNTGECVNYVGALCGINEGSFSNVTVEEDLESGQTGTQCYVKGGEFTGGIAGSDYNFSKEDPVSGRTPEKLETNENAEIKNSTSGAAVSGKKYVGGIIGYSHAGNITDCKNKGSVNASLLTADKNALSSEKDKDKIEEIQKNYQYIGGITGYQQGGELNHCTSSMGEKRTDIKPIDLVGFDVGGIAGFVGNHSKIVNCSTAGGTVLGYQYVGGILGRGENKNATPANPDETLKAENQVNKSDVAGANYVGGITGSNGENYMISGWTNQGIVSAANSYAGGIAGLNKGTIKDCGAETDTSSTSESQIIAAYQARSGGKYVGGLVGCNEGNIEATEGKQFKVNSVAIGTDCVGGLVGWNTSAGMIAGANYLISGGYIMGDTFIGGYIGLNESEQVLSQKLGANTNYVIGQYMVGGVIGGNITAVSKNIETEGITVNNFLGQIRPKKDTASAFVGGVIGYNCLTASAAEAESLREKMEGLGTRYPESKNLSDAVAEVNANTKAAAKNTNRWTLSDIRITMNQISGGLYVGGIAGYNGAGSGLTVKNAVNNTPVYSDHFVGSNDKTCRDTDVKYSYTGGITGHVSENMVIEECSNTSAGVIQTNAEVTYHGGIAEVNDGTVLNCAGDSAGNYNLDYVGGIVGRNNKNISACTLDGTITGKDGVGGIASENYGTISGKDDISEITGEVRVYGYAGGGVTGYNAPEALVSNYRMSGPVTGGNSSQRVGGIIGYGRGRMEDVSLAESGIAVSGDEYIGGYVGYLEPQQESALANLSNSGTVRAKSGYAGGIIGFIEDVDAAVSISGGSVSGDITADKGIAGGITSVIGKNISVVSASINEGNISAVNGWAGGIAARNKGSVQSCKMTGGSVLGAYRTGGIAAENSGTIEMCNISSSAALRNIQTKETGIEGETDYCLGGIAGVNKAEAQQILFCYAGRQDQKNDISINTSVAGSYVGGVAGRNGAEITASSAINANIGGSSLNVATGNLGGIAGWNEKDAAISSCEFLGTIAGGKGAEYGYGGIAGFNDGSVTACTASGSITADGDSSSIVNVGGIAGRQSAAGLIETCIVGQQRSEKTTTISSTGFGYVGGVVGWMEGTVQNINWDKNALNIETDEEHSPKKIEKGAPAIISINQGHVGGIAGYMRTGGRISNCRTYSDWHVTAEGTSGDASIGGIIGYSMSSDAQDLVNYASVTKTVHTSNSVGGIFGRLENLTSSGWKVENCINAGAITGAARVGGIIGQIKYYGGTVSKCENYGTVTAIKSGEAASAAGIVGKVFALNTNETLDISECANHGMISAGTNRDENQIAGILGNVTAQTIRITDCVNIGNIQNGGKYAAGIYGDMNQAFNLYISGCSNYGNAQGGQFSGILGGANKGSASITDCFGVSDVTFPICSSKYALGANSNNYWFGELPETITRNLFVTADSITAPVREDGVDPLENIADGNPGTRWSYMTNKKAFEIDLELDEPIELSSLYADWYGNGRNYNFSVRAETADGTDFYLANQEDDIYQWTQNEDEKAEITMIGSENAAEDKPEYGLNTAPLGNVKSIHYTVIQKTHNYSAVSEIKINNCPILLSSREYEMIQNLCLEQGYCDTYGLPLTIAEDGTQEGGYRADLVGFWEGVLKNVPLSQIPGQELPTPDRASVQDNWETYQAMKDCLAEYFNRIYPAAKPPENVRAKNQGETYLISWDASSDAYNYTVYVDLYENYEDAENAREAPKESSDQILFVRGANSAVLTIPDEWTQKYMNIFVDAVSANGSDHTSAAAADGNPYKIAAKLPAPQIHYELAGTDPAGYYRIVLDNYEDYQNIPGVSPNEVEITVSGHRDGGKASSTFTADQELYEKLVTSSNSGNVTYSTSASPTKGTTTAENCAKSGTLAYQSMLLTYDTLKGAPITSAAFRDGGKNRISGTTLEDFAYSVILKTAASMTTVYNRTELMLYDEDLGTEVVVSAGNTRLTSDGGATIPVELKNIPPDMLEKVYEKAQEEGTTPEITLRSFPWNSQEYVSYTGKRDPVAAGLLAQEINENGYAVQPEKGYVVVRSGKDNYDVYQNTIIQHSRFGNRESMEYDKQVLSARITLPPQMDKPIIEGSYTETADGKYIFKWDQNITYESPEYRVVLTGETPDGQEIQTLQATVTEQSTDEESNTYYGVSIDASALSGYKNIHMKVTRVGSAYSGTSYTEWMGSSSEADYKLYLRMDKPERPQANLTDHNKDELSYDITWMPISDEAQIQDLKEYLVTVESTADPSNIVTIAEDRDGGEDGEPGRVTADFDQFNSGDTVKIYVTAIAYTQEELGEGREVVYMDSLPGDILTMTIPERLPKPGDSEEWTLEMNYNEGEQQIPVNANDIKTILQFQEEGFLLNLNYSGASADVDAAYRIEAGIYNSFNADENGIPIPNPEEMLMDLTNGYDLMSGNKMGQASYAFGNISAEYANRYLIYRIRATSNQNISSVWSDYRSCQLPKVKNDTVSLLYDNTRLYNVLHEEAGGTLLTPQTWRDTVSWTSDTLTKSFEAKLTALDYNGEFSFKVEDNATVDGESQPDRFQVTYDKAAEDGTTETVTGILQPEEGSSNQYKYDFEVSDYGFEDTADSASGKENVWFAARLEAEVYPDGNTVLYRLVLPDNIGLNGEQNQSMYTGSVTVRALAKDSAYADSLRAQWIRTQLLSNMSLDSALRELKEEDPVDQPIASDGENAWKVFVASDLPYRPDLTGGGDE